MTGIDAVMNSGSDAQKFSTQNGLKRFTCSSMMGCCDGKINEINQMRSIKGHSNLIELN